MSLELMNACIERLRDGTLKCPVMHRERVYATMLYINTHFTLAVQNEGLFLSIESHSHDKQIVYVAEVEAQLLRLMMPIYYRYLVRCKDDYYNITRPTDGDDGA